MKTIQRQRFLLVLWISLVGFAGLNPATAWAERVTATGVISYIAPVYLHGYNSGASLNMDGGDEYIIIQDSQGNYASCAGSALSEWSTYGYVRPDHPNKKELYTLFLTSRAMNQEITCVYENAHPDDPGGCIIIYCSL